MVPIACGFNGFGQFSSHHQNGLRKFEEIELNNNSDCLLIKCTWSYLVAVYENIAQFRGFVCGASNASKVLSVGKIIDLVVCDYFCLILEESGILYKVEPSKDCELREVVFMIDRGIEYKDSRQNGIDVGFIACGNNIIFVISKSNVAYVSVEDKSFCVSRDMQIFEAKCGFEHVIIMCSDNVYTWGNGLRGQLGTGETVISYISKNQSSELYVVSALSGIKIKSVAAGGWHSAAISTDGDIYIWGWNSCGQLGIRVYKTDFPNLKEPSVYTLPQVINLPLCNCTAARKKVELNVDDQSCNNWECMPIQVTIGNRHTVLLKECGAIYATGWNAYWQLGIDTDDKCCDSFKYVMTVEVVSNNVRLMCGSWCTILH